MDHFTLDKMKVDEKEVFIKEIQEAFQYGYEAVYGQCDEMILPREDIERSFAAKGSETYFAKIDGEIVGGAVIVLDPETRHNHLDLLYTKVGCQSKGVGLQMWKRIEELHPETKVWETCTPYFETRNIHFYVNKCGFHIVEFYNPSHKDPNQEEVQVGGMSDEASEYFFRFEKRM